MLGRFAGLGAEFPANREIPLGETLPVRTQLSLPGRRLAVFYRRKLLSAALSRSWVLLDNTQRRSQLARINIYGLGSRAASFRL